MLNAFYRIMLSIHMIWMTYVCILYTAYIMYISCIYLSYVIYIYAHICAYSVYKTYIQAYMRCMCVLHTYMHMGKVGSFWAVPAGQPGAVGGDRAPLTPYHSLPHRPAPGRSHRAPLRAILRGDITGQSHPGVPDGELLPTQCEGGMGG